MKLHLTLVVCLLCMGQVISRATDEFPDENGAIESEIQSCIVARNKTGFMDLNEDCVLVIFENSELSDLFSWAKTKESLKHLVKIAIKRKFASTKVYFGLLGFESMLTVGDVRLKEDERGIYFYDTKEWTYFEEILSDYGQLFVNLHVRHWTLAAPDHDVSRLVALINSHCSDSLKGMHMNFLNPHNVIDQIQKPFQQLEHLTLENTFGNLHNDNMTFAQTFPSLNHLRFDKFFHTDDSSFFDHTIPSLKHLQAIVSFIGNGNSEDDVRRLIRNNPQIQKLNLTIHTESTVLYLLDILSKNVQHLEHLELRNYIEEDVDLQNVAVHFEHLKTLIVHSELFEVPSKTTFGLGLEEIEFGRSVSSNSVQWLEIVKNQKSLRKLTVRKGLMDYDLQQLINANLNLEEITFRCYDYLAQLDESDAQVETIVELIEKSKPLKRLTLISEWARDNFESLKTHLPTEWSISQRVGDFFLPWTHLQRN